MRNKLGGFRVYKIAICFCQTAEEEHVMVVAVLDLLLETNVMAGLEFSKPSINDLRAKGMASHLG